jgi:ABC-type uncharacterized transport system ATPase subunit
MLEVQGLSVTYGAVRALDSVSMSLAERGITTVLGPNGAGKTTLLRTISGLLRPEAGTVSCDGVDLAKLRVEDITRLGIVHVPEGGGVIRELTVEDNLRLGHLWHHDAADMRRAMAEVYEIFPVLPPKRGQLALSLSGGERQMLAIGRALMAVRRALAGAGPSARDRDHAHGARAEPGQRPVGTAGGTERAHSAGDRRPSSAAIGGQSRGRQFCRPDGQGRNHLACVPGLLMSEER